MEQRPVFIAAIFPDSAADLAILFPEVSRALRIATGVDALLVHRSMAAPCLLIEGAFEAIVKVLDEHCSDRSRWLLVRAAKPHTACGLGAADGWLRARSP